MQENTLAPYLFHQGTNYHAHEYLGVHRVAHGFVFRVWAPHAEAAFVVGDFNGWQESHPMTRVTDGGVFEATLPASCFGQGQLYKFKMKTPHGDVYKSDPYGTYAGQYPETASIYFDIDGYKWRDDGWLAYRRREAKKAIQERALNIYEVHLGSWKRHTDGSYYTYAETARELATYVKQMGYTHVELLPVMEHPYDGSWGYQVTGYFAPTSRYGTPHDFMAFVDTMHEAGIGVILDWVPAHFPKDAQGLYEFDGEPLYEYQGKDRQEHRGWGTRCFDVGREEIQSFLISNATYWAERYHADGLRVDAVASMLYLDYDRTPDEWVPNVYGDNRNLEAMAFFRKLNAHMRGAFPDVLMIAEESTAWGNLTGLENGGLGFTLKWNMGWMNDTLSYAETDPIYRKFNHGKLTFSLSYAFGEKYVLPISHDEVVHGKKSFLDRNPGDYDQKFAGARAHLAYMMTHPGKKLLFMGSEIAQFREWDYENELEWFLLDYPRHAEFQRYAAALNHLYLQTPALYERDGGWDGFQWIDPDNCDQSVISYRRMDKKGREVVVILNFTPVLREQFRVGVPQHGIWQEVLNSDDACFGGGGCVHGGTLRTEKTPMHGQAQSLKLTLPPLGAVILKCQRKFPKKQ
ncbi:MAG: 1,4-alpha-glucan branching protein GlgB [Ruminococcaceae bacterium]|nr:1,4-alpha-glucan branching protein GlgB [Oscillospiraceae bacterium]